MGTSASGDLALEQIEERPDPFPEEPEEAPWSGRDVALAFVFGALLSFGLLLILFFAVMALGVDIAPSIQNAIVTTLVYLAFSGAAWYFALRKHRAPWTALGFRQVPWQAVARMLPLAIALVIVTGLVQALLGALLGEFENPQREALAPGGRLTAPDFVWLFLIVAIVAPVAEEALFRGMLYGYLRKRYPLRTAVGISAVLFALMHFTPPVIPPLLVLGVALALVRERTGSVYPPIALHAFNNAIAVTLLYVDVNVV